MNPIITNARKGRPVSRKNRKRHSRLKITAGVALFWGSIAAVAYFLA